MAVGRAAWPLGAVVALGVAQRYAAGDLSAYAAVLVAIALLGVVALAGAVLFAPSGVPFRRLFTLLYPHRRDAGELILRRMRFRATVELGGKTATGFEVPPEVVESLGSGKRPPVTVTVNGGHTYRSTVAVMGGRYLLPLSAENRTAAGVEAGDEVDVDVELDTKPREVEVPADLQATLDDDAAVKQAWDKLSYSHKRQHVLAIEEAKAPGTRQRRIAKTLGMLR